VWSESGTYEINGTQLICKGRSGSGKSADEVCEFTVDTDGTTMHLKVLQTNSRYRINNSYRFERSAA